MVLRGWALESLEGGGGGITEIPCVKDVIAGVTDPTGMGKR